MQEMKLQALKSKSPTDLLTFAESLEVENASTMRKQELMFAILKQLASQEVERHDLLPDDRYEGSIVGDERLERREGHAAREFRARHSVVCR